MSTRFLIPSSSDKKCSLKCNLFYNYKDSPNIQVSKGPTVNSYSYLYITSTADFGASRNSVLYNSIPYNVTDIYMYNSGIHKFSDTISIPIEIVIKHRSSNNTYLYICIPVSSTDSNTSTNLIDNIITTYDASPNGQLYIQSLNLNYIIPKSPYFTHTGKYRNEDGPNDVYIVFPSNSFYINQQTLDKFTTLCSNSFDLGTTSAITLYENDKGTTENGFSGEGQIYIDCQPTDSEGEIVYKEEGYKMPKINTRTVLSVLIAILFFIFSIYALQSLKKFLTFSSVKLRETQMI